MKLLYVLNLSTILVKMFSPKGNFKIYWLKWYLGVISDLSNPNIRIVSNKSPFVIWERNFHLTMCLPSFSFHLYLSKYATFFFFTLMYFKYTRELSWSCCVHRYLLESEKTSSAPGARVLRGAFVLIQSRVSAVHPASVIKECFSSDFVLSSSFLNNSKSQQLILWKLAVSTYYFHRLGYARNKTLFLENKPNFHLKTSFHWVEKMYSSSVWGALCQIRMVLSLRFLFSLPLIQ